MYLWFKVGYEVNASGQWNLVSLLNRVPCVPVCQRGLRGNALGCQRGLRANFSLLRANVPINVPTCYTACQCFNSACQLAIWRASFSKVLRNAKWHFYTLLLYNKLYILLDIIVLNIICLYIVNKNWIILHFYTSCHIKEKCVEFFFFLFFFVSSQKLKYKKTWFLYVASNKGFLEFSTAKTTKQNKENVWDLHEL